MTRAKDISKILTDANISGNIDVDGVTNLDVVDIDGALTQDGGAVFNEASADVDFRVESNGNENMLFVDGGNDQVGIGTNATNSYYAKNLVVSSSDEGGMTIAAQNTGHQNYIMFADGTSGTERYRGYIGYDHNGDIMQMTSGGSTKFIVNDSAIAMNIDSTGAITKPLQPAFSVNASSKQNNIAINAETQVTFDVERFDRNADFGSNVFTAPVSGLYQLNCRLRFDDVDSASAYYQIYIYTSNTVYTPFTFDANEYSSDIDYLSGGGAVLADMDANDTAQIRVYQSGGTAQTDIAHGYDMHFSGYLVA